MGEHKTSFQGSIPDAIRDAIAQKIPGARIDVQGGGGHYTIEVVSPAFEGLGRVDAQRLVYGAIAHLMAGNDAPVHAVDTLRLKTS